jgi:phasin
VTTCPGHIALQHLLTIYMWVEAIALALQKRLRRERSKRHPTSAQGVASGSPQLETPKEDICHVGPYNQNHDCEARQPPETEATQAFRATAEKGTAQAKEAFEKVSAATAEATDLIKNSVATAVKRAQDYNNKVIEFTQTNTKVALEFVQKLSGAKSPSDFIELSTDRSRKQFETLTEQTKELAALAQKVTLATAEPLKTGATKAFGQRT